MIEKSELQRLTGFFPLFSVWALLYACVGLYSYYINFNINIFQYLDLSELVQITLSKFIITFIFLCVVLSFQIKLPKDGEKKVLIDVGPKSNIKLFAYPFFASVIIYFTLFLFEKGGELNNFLATIKTFTLGFAVFILPVILSSSYIYSTGSKQQVLTVLFIVVFCYSITISGIFGFYSYEELTNDPTGNSIIYDNSLIESSKHYFYIGHTKNYVFFYNDSLKSTDIYSSSMVSKMTLK